MLINRREWPRIITGDDRLVFRLPLQKQSVRLDRPVWPRRRAARLKFIVCVLKMNSRVEHSGL
jgi:hypothetical protein